ncbi:hypothetical protein Glove_320g187 [Diversispora epigaea]|uniref:Uncharacterized protein n=1 Tax=Diversispora epigaea TaxID=1348612 RepID=A0A397HS68_9GLOM|nr:hypothetical protein Glove_320g187 [Diversispora epigaea]
MASKKNKINFDRPSPPPSKNTNNHLHHVIHVIQRNNSTLKEIDYDVMKIRKIRMNMKNEENYNVLSQMSVDVISLLEETPPDVIIDKLLINYDY